MRCSRTLDRLVTDQCRFYAARKVEDEEGFEEVECVFFPLFCSCLKCTGPPDCLLSDPHCSSSKKSLKFISG